MYGQIGRGAPLLPPVAAAAATQLPVTGPNFITEVAVMAAAGLATWAMVYSLSTKLNRA
jgi:hypothetical protein